MTVLTVVDKFDIGAEAKAKYRVGADDVDALISEFGYMGVGNKGSRGKALITLETVANRGAWLACGCLNTKDSDSPIMYPQMTRGGYRTLMRNYDRAAHHAKCPFYRLRSENKDTPSCAKRKVVAGPFGILKDTDANKKGSGAVSKGSEPYTGERRTPRLARILFTVLEAAGLNAIGKNGPPDINSQYSALKVALQQYHFDSAKKICVGDFASTYIGSGDLGRLSVQLRNSGPWPTPLVPQGLLIGVVKELDNNTLISNKGDRLEIDGRLIRPGEDTPGPYIAIVLVGKANKTAPFEALQAFVHPVMSTSLLVPVDSNLERHTLAILMARQRYQFAHTPFRIIKPLTDLLVGNPPELVRPDFILEYEAHKVVVETMGYLDQDYLQRKQRTHAIMAKLGKVICHGLDRDADTELRKAINQTMQPQN